MRAFGGLALAGVAIVLTASGASAHDRVEHAAVGAVAEAVVAGPVGFVGGGLIGYVAGPRIGCDLGLERCHRYRRVRYRRSNYGAAPAPRRVEHHEHFRGPGDLGTREDHGNY
jgi:hypothetical protein